MKYIPNTLSASRLLLGFAVCIASAAGLWAMALWLFVVAALSDAVDGTLARRLDATSDLGRRLDQAGDLVLLCGTALGLTLGSALPPEVFVGGVVGLAIGLILGRANGSVVTHTQFVAGIIIFTGYLMIMGGILATQAYGLHVWYLAVGVAVAGSLAALKRDRLRS